jgi:hypothetical protein
LGEASCSLGSSLERGERLEKVDEQAKALVGKPEISQQLLFAHWREILDVPLIKDPGGKPAVVGPPSSPRSGVHWIAKSKLPERPVLSMTGRSSAYESWLAKVAEVLFVSSIEPVETRTTGLALASFAVGTFDPLRSTTIS